MHAIKVSNIPKWVSELNLRDFFLACGPALKSEIVSNKVGVESCCVGFVVFLEEEGMQNALAKDGSRLDGEVIKVEQCSEDELNSAPSSLAPVNFEIKRSGKSEQPEKPGNPRKPGKSETSRKGKQ